MAENADAESVYRFVWVGVRDWSWHYKHMHLSVSLYFMRICEKITGKPLLVKHLFLLQSHIRGFFLLWCPSQGQNWNKYKLFEHKGDTFVPDIWTGGGKDDSINWKLKYRSIKPKIEICMPQGGTYRNYLPQNENPFNI